jgi:hypothetical protein
MNRNLGVVVVASFIALGGRTPVLAQSGSALTPGDVVRVDHEFVGTLMSISPDATLTVLGEGKPICWPGIGHGDAPRCDPAPPVRRVVDWRGVTVERQLAEQSHIRRTAVGSLIGAAVAVPLGYLTGPGLGYGEIDGCYENASAVTCGDPIPRTEFEARQRARDQKRGAIFFGAVGATLGAIVARRTANDWIEVRPPVAGGGEPAWSLGLRLPVGQR